MAKEFDSQAYYSQHPSAEANIRLRDLEEKQRILKDRILLVGETLVKEREKNFSDIQELKDSLIKIKEENSRIKELLQRVTEFLSSTAKKSELEMLQRQFDLFRK
mgnify:CR=1 FL=1